MANDTIPMPQMFTSCYEVLCEKLVPLHYAKITELALSNLGLMRKDVNWHRQIEDVREKMLLAGQYGTFYVSHPLCLGGLRWWFDDVQLRLLKPSDGIIIPGHAARGAKGAFQALMRTEYMRKKTTASLESIMEGRSRGLVLEAHVAGWFRENWPEFYRSPENEGDWQSPCNHDFKLVIDGQTFEIDVSGPRRDGQFGDPGGGKKKAALHLLCAIDDQNVYWKSIIRGTNFREAVMPDFEGICPERMIVWLNCKREGLDYEAIKAHLISGN